MKLVPVVFGIIGICQLGIGVWLAVGSLDLSANGMRAEGTVVRLQRKYSRNSNGDRRYFYYPVVQFRTDAGETVEFHGSKGSSSPAYRRGARVAILYPAETPTDAKIESFGALWGAPLILSGLGTVFTLIAAGFLYIRVRRRRLEEWMHANGSPVEADYTGVHRDTSFTVNGRSPWRIAAQWQDPADGRLHLFESKHLWFDPEPFIAGDRITVLIDPRNPKRHVFDLSFLPEVAA